MRQFIYLILALIISSCVKEDDIITVRSGNVQVRASILSTRTTFTEDDNAIHVTWNQSDKIGLYTKEQFNLGYKAETSGTETSFKNTADHLKVMEGDTVYAYYPYISSQISEENNKIKIRGNSVQDCYADYYDVLYAKGVVSNNQVSLNFRHLYAYIKLTLPTNLLKPMNTGSWLQINSSENIGVDSDNTFDYKSGEVTGSTKNHILYYIPDTVTADKISCYIAILPQSENAILEIEVLNHLPNSSLLIKRAPVGGFLAGNVYSLDLENEIEKAKSEEREALIEFYNVAGGKGWKYQTNWCSDKPIEEWAGVEVNKAGLVKYLHLGGNTFVGYIPEKIINLKQLKNLWISGDENKFSKLNADESLKNINKLTNLRQLMLDNIVLDTDISKIDFSSLKNLEVFSVIDCHLYGELPEAMKSLTKIRDLRFSNNRNLKENGEYYGISGDISSFFPYWPYLERFEASSCMLSGSLPEISDEQGARLTTFFVEDNAFRGVIPESHIKILDNMKKIQDDPNLEWNRFGYNISENLLSGKIPDAILNHEIFPIYLYQIMLQEYEPYVFDKTDIPWWTYKLISTDGTEYDFGKIFKNNRYTILWNLSEAKMAMNKDDMEWPRKMEKLMDLYKDKGLEIYVNQSFDVTDSRMKEIMSYMPSAKLICVDNKKNNPYNKVSSFLFPNNYFSSCEDGSAYGQFFIIDSSVHLIYCGYGGGPRMKYMHGYPETNVDIFDFVTKLFK